MINHYHILDKSGKTQMMIPIGPPPLHEPYHLCRSTFSFLNEKREWVGDRYDPTGDMCVCAIDIGAYETARL